MPPPRVVRRPSPKKVNRLRIAWFILGLLAGLLLSSVIQSVTGIQPAAEPDAFAMQSPVKTQETESPAVMPATESEPEPALIPPVSIAKPTPPNEFTLKVRKGDTLSNMLTGKGVNYNEAHSIIAALKPHYNPRQIVVGQEITLKLNENKFSAESAFDVERLHIKLSPLRALELNQQGKGSFEIAVLEAELSEELASGGGVINSSLYQTGVDSGVPPAILGTLINAYSYDVDFQREIKPGDKFNVVFETLKNDSGETAGYGDVLYATLTLGDVEKKIYHFTRENGEEGFYDEKGHSVRKALLRTPINGARLSSGFGMRRHPILGYGRMHKGVDFAAPRGTPVFAAGDGVVEYAARKGSYGNYVRLRHNNQYATAYAHLKGFSKAARRGNRVKQGDVIGYVGSTGASTGPHLHYEVLSAGRQVNPKNVKFPTGHTLSGQELAAFQESIKQINLIASRLIDNEAKLASAE